MGSIIDIRQRLLRLFLRLLSPEQSCEHAELVCDEINDVYCKFCRKDFTG